MRGSRAPGLEVPGPRVLVPLLHHAYRFEKNKDGSRIMIFIRDTIYSKILEEHIFPYNVESIFVEINVRKCKWLLRGTYHLSFQSKEYFFNNLDKALPSKHSSW